MQLGEPVTAEVFDWNGMPNLDTHGDRAYAERDLKEQLKHGGKELSIILGPTQAGKGMAGSGRPRDTAHAYREYQGARGKANEDPCAVDPCR